MTVTCPEGHQSEATDYCDICGTPIEAAPGAGTAGPDPADGARAGTPGPVIPPAAEGSVLDLDPAPAPTLTCPHCGAPNVADALFCEDCGYDFTTGAAPLGSAPVVPDEGQQESALDLGTDAEDIEDVEDQDWPDGEPEDADEGVGTGDRVQDDDAGSHDEDADVSSDEEQAETEQHSETEPEEDLKPAAEAHTAGDAEPAAGAHTAGDVQPEDDAQTSADAEPQTGAEPDADPAGDPEPDPAPQPEHAAAEAPAAPKTPEAASPDRGAAAAHVRPRHTPPSRALSDTWVVEMWVDPDWYAVQQTEEACPSPGLPDIVVVRRNVVLIGRPSGSLGVRPDVDAGGDSAVSRRHAQLTSDGSRWWIEDLGSSNGTYVGSVGEPLPTEPVRQRVEIDRDDRIYVGAWTRLVLRQATASEQAGQG